MGKKFTFFMLTLLIGNWAFAQPFENENEHPWFLHVVTGISSYSGDLKLEKYSFTQSKPLFAVGIQKYLSNRFSVRSELTYTNIQADDKLSGEKYRLKRKLNFTSSVIDLSVLAQYDLRDLSDSRVMVPYLFAGGSVFKYNPYTTDTLGRKISIVAENEEGATYQLNQFSLIAGLGLKIKINEYLHFGAETHSKFLFTDYIDGVSLRGNPKKVDNIYFTSVRLAINLAAFRRNTIHYYRN